MRVRVQRTALRWSALVSVVFVAPQLARAFPFFQSLAMLQNPSSTSRGHLAPLLTSPLQPDYRGRRDPRCSCEHKALTTCLHDSQSPRHAKAGVVFQVVWRQQLYDVHQSLALIVRCNAFLIARGKVKMASLVFSICQPLSAVDRCSVRPFIYLFCCRWHKSATHRSLSFCAQIEYCAKNGSRQSGSPRRTIC